ncbi:hypothetical protein HDV63DRAFT_287360 [Trichoderma sp. SZMC 28014]
MVTHSTTNLPVNGLSMGEQTGSRIFHYLWSYVLELVLSLLISTEHSETQEEKGKNIQQPVFADGHPLNY